MSQKRSYDLVGIGNAMLDVMVHVDDAFLKDNKIQKGVMTLIDDAEAHALYGKLEPAIEASGGSVSNSMAIFASLGGKGAYIGKVADDQFGEIIGHDMRAIGVHFNTAPLREGPSTARCMIMVTPDAERTMCTYLGACAQLAVADLDRSLIADSHITFLEGYLFDREEAKAAFREAGKIAHDAGNKIALTLSDPRCVERHRDDFLDLLKNHVDILFANEKEICSLYDTDDINKAAEQVRSHCGIAVLTRGSKGALILTPNETIAVPAAKVQKLVDTTGAGDSFAAAFLYGLTQGKPLAECGWMAAVVAGEIVSQVGARPQKSLSKVLEEKRAEIIPPPAVRKPPKFGPG